MIRRASIVVLALLATVPVFTAQAEAQTGGVEPAPDAKAAAAAELMARGVRLRREQDDARALQLFRQAYQLLPSPRAQAQMALAEQASAQWAEAERDLREALHAKDNPWIVRNREELETALSAISNHMGQLDLETNAEGAELLLNGERLVPLPVKGLRIAAGRATFEVRATGYQPVRHTTEILGGTTVHERIELFPLAQVEVVHATPAPIGALPVEHLAVERPTHDGSTRRVITWSLLGAGAAMLLEGAFAHIVRENRLSVYNDDSRCFFGTETRDARCGGYKHDAETAQTFMTIGYVAGGLMLAGSLGLWLTEPRQRPRSAVQFWFSPSRDRLGISYAAPF